MLSRGLYLAIEPDDIKTLRRTKGDVARRNLVAEWEETWPSDWSCDTDKAWKLISRALGHFPGPAGENEHVGLGLGYDMFYAKTLHRAQFYIIGLVSNDWITAVCETTRRIDSAEFREAYFSREVIQDFEPAVFKEVHGFDPIDEERCSYAWHWFDNIQVFFERVNSTDRSVVFTAENS